MQGSLEKGVLSQPLLAVPDRQQKDLLLSRFLNLQVRREDFEQADQPMILQGEVADIFYSAEKQALIIQLWWLVKLEEDEEGCAWVDFNRLQAEDVFVMMVHVPFDKLLSLVEAFSLFGVVSIKDTIDQKVLFTMFSKAHEENVSPEEIPGLEYLDCTM